jgi:hypothetical protein
LHQIKSIECLGAGFADEFEYLAEIDQLAGLVPPLLFALVAREELDFAPIGEAMLDLDYVVNTAHGTVHCAKSYPIVEIARGTQEW